jgi:4-carboxymuconolactone decarboxylase
MNLKLSVILGPIAIFAALVAVVLVLSRVNAAAQQNASPGAGAAAKPVAITLPADVYADSGFRLPLPKREALDAEGQRVYDMVVNPNTRTLAGLRGPLGIQLYSPKVAELEHELNDYLRYQAGFSGTVRELAILITAREFNNQFEWGIHERVARQEGLDPKIIDVVKFRKSTAGLPEKETVIIELGRQMFGQKTVTAETYARALKLFGPRGLVDLASLMGNYASKAALLSVFNAMDIQAGANPRLPLP